MGTTPQQILANQRNAQFSTGPATPEGKVASSRNATKHGLTGAFRVLPHESQEDFDRLLASLRAEFQPSGEHEAFLVEQMAQSRWRLARAQRLEAAVMEQMEFNGGGAADPEKAIANYMLMGGDRPLSNAHRYVTAAERSYYKAHSELLRSQKLRNEAKPAAEPLDAEVLARVASAVIPSRHPAAASARSAAVRNEPNPPRPLPPEKRPSATGNLQLI